MQIEALTGHAHLGRHLASWHHDEFGHLYDETVWNEQTAVAEFEAMARPGCPDITWVAFDGDGRDGEHVLGSVSLVGDDDLTGFEHLTPWLASLFVIPAARGRGVGNALMDHLLAAAHGLGQSTYTSSRPGRSATTSTAAGGALATVVTGMHHDQNTAVMAKSTSPRGAR